MPGTGIVQQIIGPGRAAAADDCPGRERGVDQGGENRLVVVARLDGSEHQYKTLWKNILATHVFKFRLRWICTRNRNRQRHHDLDLRRVDAQAFRQLLAGRSADRDDPAGPPQRTAVELQGEKPFGERIEMRVAQEIEIRNRHHRRHAPQMHGQRQRRLKAMVKVNMSIIFSVNDILMLRSVMRQYVGKVLGIGPAGCGGSCVESYFHNLVLKNWSIWQIIVIFIE